MITSIFKNLCPNCGGDITSERLYKGLPCDKCLPQEPKDDVCDVLKKGKFKILCDIDDEVSNWQNFKKAFNHLQKRVRWFSDDIEFW